MTKTLYSTPPSSVLGQAMLDAWLCGDRLRLTKNLRDVSSFPVPSALTTERERLETLKTIAHEMTRTPDLFASRSDDPRIGSWISLLDHLANSGVPVQLNRAEGGSDPERRAASGRSHLAREPRFAVNQTLEA